MKTSLVYSFAKEAVDVIHFSRFLLDLEPFLFALLDVRGVDGELVTREKLAAACNQASLLEGRSVDEFLEASHMQPMPAEGTFRHHRLVLYTLSQVRHEWIIAALADCRGDEPHEVVGEVLDRVVDLRLGHSRHYLPTAIETGRHSRILVILVLLLLFVPLLVLQVQFELSATLAVHRSILQRGLLVQKVHVVLYLRPRCNLDSVQICLSRAHSFAEANFALVDVNFTTGLIPGLSAIPKPFDDNLGVAHKNLREHLVEVVLLQLHFDHLLRVLLGDGELEQRLEVGLFEGHTELAELFEGFERVALLRADHRLDRGEF